MRPLSIHLKRRDARALFKHMKSGPERVAFLRCAWSSKRRQFRVKETRVLPSGDASARTHVSISDEQRIEILSWASSNDDALIEAHSHGTMADPARFSGYDIDELANWVPHVRWRLSLRPYAALVFGGATFDGLAWIDDVSDPQSIHSLKIGWWRQQHGTGVSIDLWK